MAASHLGDAINTATRTRHSTLNRLILLRLPLALPPVSPNPSAYVSGLLHVAPIYVAFETLWQDVLGPHDDESEPCDDRMRSVLSHVFLPGLARSACLRSDICSATGWADHEVDERLGETGRQGVLKGFLDHIEHSVATKPHVLLAYAWVLYMALFAGGRFVRATLEAAGTEFWATPAGEVRLTGALTMACGAPSACDKASFPLSFLRFQGADDLKAEFKNRLVQTESLLTPGEHDDVVREAGRIFDYLVRLISQLDSYAMASGNDKAPRLGGLRDSVSVAKERALVRRQEKAVDDDDDDDDWPVPIPCPARSRSSTTTSSISVRGLLTPAAELADLMTMTTTAAARSVHFDKRTKKVPHGRRDGWRAQGPRTGMDGAADGEEAGVVVGREVWAFTLALLVGVVAFHMGDWVVRRQ